MLIAAVGECVFEMNASSMQKICKYVYLFQLAAHLLVHMSIVTSLTWMLLLAKTCRQRT